MKKAAVVGHFAAGKNLLNGQTVKTKIVTSELEKQFGSDQIIKIDTHGGIKTYARLPFLLFRALLECKNVIILPAHNGLKIIAPMLDILNIPFRRGLHYVVIGGWLPEYLNENSYLKKHLRRFRGIYVETRVMKRNLKKQGFCNVRVIPNCKELKILEKEELVYCTSEPYRLCTFSRVMKEKGIEDAVNAVRQINESAGRVVFSLDIFGMIEPGREGWFENLSAQFPDYVRYGGMVPFDKSTDVLKNYFSILFPTTYEGEGFAGTLIDAQAAGVPVLASDWRYNSEIVKDGVNGMLHKAGSLKELTDCLLRLAQDPSSWNDMKPGCLERARHYIPSECLKPLLKRL